MGLPDPAVVAMVASVLLGGLLLVLRRLDQRERDKERLSYHVRFPADLKPEVVQAFLRVLSGLPRTWLPHHGESTVVFETVATGHEIHHYLHVPEGQASFVVSQLRALIPTARITEAAVKRVAPSLGIEVQLSDRDRELDTTDPVTTAASLMASTQPLQSSEGVVIQWLLAPAIPHPVRSDGTGVASTWKQALMPTGKPDPEIVKAARDKVSAPLFRAVGRVGVVGDDPDRARHLLWRVMGSLHSLRQPGVSLRRRWLPEHMVARRVASARTPILSYPCRLNARELTGLIAWPIQGPQIPGLALAGSRSTLPDPAVPRGPRVVGEATFSGAERPIALPEREALHHLHVVGPTGVGKSTLLANLILQDIADGRGVVVIDPKGDLVADVADRIPAGQADRVVLLDPTDEGRPIGLNLLAGAHEAPELVTDQVIAIFHQMYAAFWGPRTQDVLHAGLLTLSAEPGLTLCELPVLLTNDAFRRRLVSRIDDAIALGPFWNWYDQLKSGERAQAIGPVQNKLRPLLLRRRVRNIIGQAQPTFTMTEVLAEPKVLLVSLAKGLLGPEAASLIGSLVVAQLWQAVQARAGMPAAQRRPAFVYADEFQEYTALPTDIADVLAQARGFGVGMVLAHQHLGQVPAQVRAAVMANARSRVVFQAAADDAGVLSRQLSGGLTPNDLQDLGAFEIYASLYAGGRVRSPISARTYPMPEPLRTSERVRDASRSRYGRDRAAVEAEIVSRQQQTPPERPVGRTGRRL